MPTAKPDAPATARNREPILAVLRSHFADRQRVLEIGSGTGQHAVYFAAQLPHLHWQCSDRAENLAGINAWLAECGSSRTPAALCLDVCVDWPVVPFDAVFSANTLHIMSWSAVAQLFAGLALRLGSGGKVVIYGPFNYAGIYTSASNAAFDQALRAESPERGIRDFAQVEALAQGIGLRLLADVPMPANNRCLVWQRDA